MLRRAQGSNENPFIIVIFSLLGIATTGVFGVLHLVINHNTPVGILELTGSAAIALNLFTFQLNKKITLANHLFILILLALLVLMLISGGIERTGIFWFFIFPLAAFFLTGRKQGLVWLAALYMASAATVVIANLYGLALPYSAVEIRQLLITLLVVTISMYVYELSRERAEIAVRRGKKELQAYLDNMTTLSAKVSYDGTILFANQIAKKAFGSGEKVIGTNFIDGSWWTFDKAVHERVQAAFERVLQGKKVGVEERMRIAAADGPKIIHIHFSMIPIFEQGHLIYILAEGQDISQEFEIEQTKSEFVSLASHQLRTPISAIQWYSEMLLSGDVGKLAKEQRSYVQQVYDSNIRLGIIVDAMLTVSMLEMGKFVMHPTTVDIAKECQSIIHDLKHSHLQEKKLVIHQTYDPDLPLFHVDRTAINRIIRNVISNAFKYTPTGGSIEVKITRVREKAAGENSQDVQIIISDTGYGIPVSQQKNIFVKLFRATNIKEKDTDGTGLGLYIIKAIIEHMGGQITFTSKEDKGSTFTILLPLHVASSKSSSPTQSHSDGAAT